jgi:hypothetical protein
MVLRVVLSKVSKMFQTFQIIQLVGTGSIGVGLAACAYGPQNIGSSSPHANSSTNDSATSSSPLSSRQANRQPAEPPKEQGLDLEKQIAQMRAISSRCFQQDLNHHHEINGGHASCEIVVQRLGLVQSIDCQMKGDTIDFQACFETTGKEVLFPTPKTGKAIIRVGYKLVTHDSHPNNKDARSKK